ncbi:class I SAM-dependent methyltransferase [Streptoalloteichus hindustanus]|uniref:Ubiquinone/menaquinone biosynthesis C-methylase UbiE n=1 Tax=Streptoalloteichus hindustanus TaxID=2017 RepID=A0A1M5GNM0_STRHI|nr:class I SAM-dependent methyltransferase [Streptoalloteichus hindustanus]SHG05112.1 Ubiquinone/menaquinone biosynthesis C-methylase UbiE [Streptoalloteichus hindustanus]
MADEVHPDPDLLRYYGQGAEADRLRSGSGLLELLRTQDLLRRFLPPPPAKVLDLGGATGVHAEWLVTDGYRVDLVDAVPAHVEQAATLPGVRARVGDARALEEADSSYDAVLMLGPLYHLVRREDRLRAWREATRVVRPGGLVAAATVSRFASLHDGFRSGLLTNGDFREMVARDLADGRHRPPPGKPWSWFTNTYFHLPEEAAAEARAVGLESPTVLGVECSAWLLAEEEIDEWLADPDRRGRLLWGLRRIEREPSLLGVSAHLLTLANRSL